MGLGTNYEYFGDSYHFLVGPFFFFFEAAGQDLIMIFLICIVWGMRCALPWSLIMQVLAIPIP